MSREVLVVRWCDGPHQVPEEAVIERKVSLDDGEVVLLDLCSVCDQGIISPLVDLILAGVSVEQAMKIPTLPPTRPVLAPDSTTCPDCGMVSKNRSALGQHLRKLHDTGIRDYPKT